MARHGIVKLLDRHKGRYLNACVERFRLVLYALREMNFNRTMIDFDCFLITLIEIARSTMTILIVTLAARRY